MGWRGALRSLEAAARAGERDAERRRKLAFKAQLATDAAEAVAAWEQLLDDLTHLRSQPGDPIDWANIANQPAPSVPRLLSTHMDAARRALDSFEPRFFDFLSGGSERKRQKLEAELERAPSLDAADFAAAKAAHIRAFDEWKADVDVANGVLRHDPSTLKTVVEGEKPFSGDGFIGSSIAFSFSEEYVHAVPKIHGSDIVPATRLKLTATGKLSETKMPASQFNEIYYDYVASVPLRVASMIFKVLPIGEVYVTCVATMLNTQNGHQEPTPILSVMVVRDTFERLDLVHVDASDALANFKHTVEFKKATGFQRVEPLKPT